MVVNGSLPNYPDILGFITGGERLTVANCVQVAIAVRPQTITAGKPFAVVALLQNITDVSVRVMAVLNLPDRDDDGQSGRFAAKETSMDLTLFPAEVGYLVLPVNCQMNTATGSDYGISVTFHAKTLGRPRQIRNDEVPATVNYYFRFTPHMLERLSRMRTQSFTANKKGFLGGKTLVTGFAVKPGGEQKITRKQPNWVRLWTISGNTDARPLVERYAHVLMRQVLPTLEIDALYRPLLEANQQRLWSTGYDISEVEAHFITKLMLDVLRLAHETDTPEAHPGEHSYRVARTIKMDWPDDGTPIPMPHWTRALLERVGYDNLVLESPVAALAGPLYGDLLDDAIHHGFDLVYAQTQIRFTRDDIAAYSAQVTDALWDPDSSLGLIEVYLPLVLGGVLTDERAAIPHENKLEDLKAVRHILDQAKAHASQDDLMVIELAEDVTAKMLQKYGYRMGRY